MSLIGSGTQVRLPDGSLIDDPIEKFLDGQAPDVQVEEEGEQDDRPEPTVGR